MHLFILVWTVFGSVSALAEDPNVPANLIPVIDNVGLTVDQIKEKNDLIRAIEVNEKNISAMEQRIKDQVEFRRADPKTDRGIQQIRSEIEYIQKGVAKFKQELTALKTKLDSGTLAKAKEELAQIAKLKLDAKLSDQRFQVLEVGHQVDAIERHFDDSVAAEHLRAKLARLLSNSNAFCPSVQACQGGKSVDFSQANELLNDIFYNRDGTLGREKGSGKTKKSPTHDGNQMGTF